MQGNMSYEDPALVAKFLDERDVVRKTVQYLLFLQHQR